MALPRDHRLRKRRDFLRVYQDGRRARMRSVTVFALPAEAPDGVRIGFTVTKRLGRAVARNMVRRRLRGQCAALLPRIRPGLDIVVNAAPWALKSRSSDLHQEIVGALRKINALRDS